MVACVCVCGGGGGGMCVGVGGWGAFCRLGKLHLVTLKKWLEDLFQCAGGGGE